jgi:hypothetical protein
LGVVSRSSETLWLAWGSSERVPKSFGLPVGRFDKRKKAVFASSESPMWLAMADVSHGYACYPMEVLRR